MLGATPGMGKALGLDEKWAYNAIKAVGNYGEIFDRNVGKDSPLKLDRGINNCGARAGCYTRSRFANEPQPRIEAAARQWRSGPPAHPDRGARRPARSAVRAVFIQILFVAAIVALAAFLVHNTQENLRRQNIVTGFDFLEREPVCDRRVADRLFAADTYTRPLSLASSTRSMSRRSASSWRRCSGQ